MGLNDWRALQQAAQQAASSLMDTPAPDWIPVASRHTYPGWVQRKAVTLCKRDQKRGGNGNVQQYRLAIHQAVLASGGRDHWTGESLAWELIGTYDPKEAAADRGEHRKQYAMLPTIASRSGSLGLISWSAPGGRATPSTT